MRYVRLIRNVSNWWRFLALKAGWLEQDPVRFRLRHGVRLDVPRRLLHEFKEIFLEECYTRGLPAALSVAPAIVDVGANAGFFSLFAASRWPGARIVACEPMTANFRQLRHNRELNPSVSLTCVPEAVYSRTGEIVLCCEAADALTTAASIVRHDASRPEAVHVPSVSLVDLFNRCGIDRCDLLKLDCEGAEYDILYDGPPEVLDRIDQAVIEVHPGDRPEHGQAALSAFFHDRNFETRASGDILYARRRR